MKVTLESYTMNPEQLIGKAARICYDSVPKELDGERKFIKSLIRSGHTSTIEHASASFLIEDVSRALTHQLVRHRIASYSQRSQRYVKENEPKFVIPDKINENPEAKIEFFNQMTRTWESYSKLLKMGIKAEDARMVLPNACYTKIMVTMNFSAWRHFLYERLSPRAQKEIRDLAGIIVEELYKIAPSCFEDLKNGQNIHTT